MKNLILTLIFILCVSFIIKSQDNPHFEYFKGISKKSNEPKNPLLDLYDVKFYFLDIEVTNTSKYIAGNVTIKAETTADVFDLFALQLEDVMTVDSVKIDGNLCTYTHSGSLLSINVSPAMPSGQLFDAIIYYHGLPESSSEFFSGVSNDQYDYTGDWVTWTLSESFHSKEWWPCKEVLTDKADSSWVFLTIDNNLKAGSNGVLTNITDMGSGKVRYEWKSGHPIAYYLISFAVAEYADYSLYAYPAGSDPVLIQNYIYNASWYLDYYQEALDESAGLIELFSDKYILYPYADEKYGHCAAPLGGGMEHQTMTTMGYFEFWIIAHEMAHMWFGDYITCATWQDIWINEGFASYSEYIALQFLKTQADADSWMLDAHDYSLGEPEGSVYVPFDLATNEGRIFSYALSYKKGAAIIHQMRFEINNDSLFFAVLKEHLNTNGNSNATGDQFKDIMNSVTGTNYDTYFDHWYYGEGFPIFDVLYYQDGFDLHFTVTESTSSSFTPFFQTHMEYLINFSDGTDTTIRVFQDESVEDYLITGITKTVTGMVVDPSDWIIDQPGDVVAGIYENESENVFFTVSPNPATDFIKLAFLDEMEREFTITDVTGKILYKNSSANAETHIDVSSFESGMYFISVSSGKMKLVKKLIIK
ncbi:MAG: hypothetical protein A2W91_10880 [Bacteroidetes bacterium GWF2_38_335]|nr:MAG: hypothetical protein A2W91_10880 [Bacteroidetes bacterium GWF2_38_335]OFY81795.1 MAG: hypothetical protein A2281_06160 [Bacteroidetes bacterium RIFOXYA12_FULL_38_20]HBS87865.1 hypothetical protein [Bacteroidales bacterium]